MIPKIVHYVWLGPDPLPPIAQNCINSWHRLLPEYQLMHWGNEQAALIDNHYLQQAIHLKKWAFASDVIRLYALNKYGGIYLDTDVEVLQPLDGFLQYKFFTGHEFYNQFCSPITTAVLGAEPELPLITEFLSLYAQAVLYGPGYLDQTANTHRLTDYLRQKYAIPKLLDPNTHLTLEEGHEVFPSHYFCTPTATPSYAIHHFSGSWLYQYSRKLKYSWGKKIHLIRFIPEKNQSSGQLPLLPGESVLIKFVVKTKVYALIKSTHCA